MTRTISSQPIQSTGRERRRYPERKRHRRHRPSRRRAKTRPKSPASRKSSTTSTRSGSGPARADHHHGPMPPPRPASGHERRAPGDRPAREDASAASSYGNLDASPGADRSSASPATASTTRAPVFRDLHVPAGTGVSVRINQTLDSKLPRRKVSNLHRQRLDQRASSSTAKQSSFQPAPESSGRVVPKRSRSRPLQRELFCSRLRSPRPPSPRREHRRLKRAITHVEGKGRGKNTAEKVGGGAAVGAILGGIFGGGKVRDRCGSRRWRRRRLQRRHPRPAGPDLLGICVVDFRLANGFTIRSAGRAEEPARRGVTTTMAITTADSNSVPAVVVRSLHWRRGQSLAAPLFVPLARQLSAAQTRPIVKLRDQPRSSVDATRAPKTSLPSRGTS